tara:strand:+ start:866 stop:1459 length:594 start_codon:yes stop_codon:yes gene_type:complete
MLKKTWYENPTVLLNSWNILPFTKNITKNINSLARLAFIMMILINISNLSQKYHSIPIILLIFSFIMKPIENFSVKKKKYENCRFPTKENPFMNFTAGEYIKNPKAKPACPRDEDVKKACREKFLEGRKDYNVTDFFNRNHSDIAFYTMPVTTAINDQKGFAKKLFGDGGLCRSYGKNCLKNIDNKYHRSRFYYRNY